MSTKSFWSKLVPPGLRQTRIDLDMVDTTRMASLFDMDLMPPPVAEEATTTGALLTQIYGADQASNSTMPPQRDALYPGDSAMIEKLIMQHAITGTYDLDVHTEGDLVRWQRSVLMEYFAMGSSPRLNAIEDSLHKLRLGTWLSPDERRNSIADQVWWASAMRFSRRTAHCPSIDGRMHPSTPAEEAHWARQQLKPEVLYRLSLRQLGELRRLGICQALKPESSPQTTITIESRPTPLRREG